MKEWLTKGYFFFPLGMSALGFSLTLLMVGEIAHAILKACQDFFGALLFFSGADKCDGFKALVSGLRDKAAIVGPFGVVLLVVGIVLFVRHKWRS